jgi:hypothetical protein
MNLTRKYLLAAVPLLSLLALPVWAQATPAPLNYSTTWFGNTFGGGPHWVQNFAHGMSVDPDGNVYVASEWDEGGREFGIYRDGKIAGAIPDTHGWGTGGGRAIVASNNYIFIAHSQGNEGGGLKGEPYPPAGKTWYGVSRRKSDGSHAPFEGGRGRFKTWSCCTKATRHSKYLGWPCKRAAGCTFPTPARTKFASSTPRPWSRKPPGASTSHSNSRSTRLAACG